MNTREHWNRVYTEKDETAVSWYQPRPQLSLSLIRSAAPSLSTPIIDIGGGASNLVGELLAHGYADLTVLDISEAALVRTKARLAHLSDKVRWIVSDITTWQPDRTWQVWHDRAVFHFLTETADQDAYIAALGKATGPGASVVIATFALNGPERCSGLPVQRYSPETLAQRLGLPFEYVKQAAETHTTPAGSTQEFSYAVFRKAD